MKIYFLRHGETHWNQLKKFQGHTDISLSEKGIADVANWRIPEDIEHWFVSPLDRTRQTAEIHHLKPVTIVENLIEACWGDWEGQILKQLRKTDPNAIAEIEARGLDMRAPGGESPREVRARLSLWLSSLQADYSRIGVITHRGVIRAGISLATDWDMKSDHPVNITHNQAYEFTWIDSQLNFITSHDLLI